MASVAGKPARSSFTGFCCPEITKAGASSARGARTNRRRCARGCGRKSADEVLCSDRKVMRSRSSGRASFNTTLGWRPNSRSSASKNARRDSGVSLARGIKPTTAFINGGEPGGQSTGSVFHKEDFASGKSEQACNRLIAAARIVFESPRLEPKATYAQSDGFKEG